jgi:hypothetical protein
VVVLRAAVVERIVAMKFDAAGNLRADFGSGGRWETPCAASASAVTATVTVAVDVATDAQDNAYVVAACLDTALVPRARVFKLDRSGQLVATFGEAGVVSDVFQAGAAGSEALTVAVDASGNAYVGGRIFLRGTAGFECSDAAVAKLDASGHPVTTFGMGGRALFDLGPDGGLDAAEQVALDAAGRIYVAASARSCTDRRPGIIPYVVLRLLP